MSAASAGVATPPAAKLVVSKNRRKVSASLEGWSINIQVEAHSRDNRQALQASSLLKEVVRCLELLGKDIKLLVGHGSGTTNVVADGTLVLNGLDDVAGTSLALGADHTVMSVAGLCVVDRT